MKIKVAVIGGIILAIIFSWWLFYVPYLRTLKNIPKEITNENYFQILDALSKLPNTQMLLTTKPRPDVSGDEKTIIKKKTSREIEAQLVFSKIENFHDPEARSARIFIKPPYRPLAPFPETIDLSKTILMARARIKGNVVVDGHLSSRLQFELYDVQGRVMRGPKVVALNNGRDNIVILRPTVNDPIPTGFADPQFDVANVTKIAVRFSLGTPQGLTTQTFRGELLLDEMIIVRDLDLIKRFFPSPDPNRVARDKFNMSYELRRHKWNSEKKEFFVGINYPWRNYGSDFGRNPWGNDPPRDGWALHEEELARDFSQFREIGITHVRLYMFCDFRGALLTTDNGYALDQYVLEDTEAVLRAAQKTGIKLIPVFFDFGIGNTAVGEYISKGRPELVFSWHKYQLFSQVITPFLRKLEMLNTQYGKPIAAIELMNEPDNMALLMVPGYYESLKSWLADLAIIAHNETTMKVTLGSRSFPDFQRWWHDVAVDEYQFHFYADMTNDMPPSPMDVKRPPSDKLVFCGELDPYRMEENIPRLKEQEYDGVLLWSFKSRDGFYVDLPALQDILKRMKSGKNEPSPEKIMVPQK